MARSLRARRAARRELLDLLADELRREDGPGHGLRVRLRTPPGRATWLCVGRPGWHRPLRVHCVSLPPAPPDAGQCGFVVSSGWRGAAELIGAADLADAARAVAAVAGRGPGGRVPSPARSLRCLPGRPARRARGPPISSSGHGTG